MFFLFEAHDQLYLSIYQIYSSIYQIYLVLTQCIMLLVVCKLYLKKPIPAGNYMVKANFVVLVSLLLPWNIFHTRSVSVVNFE